VQDYLSDAVHCQPSEKYAMLFASNIIDKFLEHWFIIMGSALLLIYLTAGLCLIVLDRVFRNLKIKWQLKQGEFEPGEKEELKRKMRRINFLLNFGNIPSHKRKRRRQKKKKQQE
jgi:hypothetical protein